jgi:CRISPR/Cas system-associated exonuclease Cas4 (RecB family)
MLYLSATGIKDFLDCPRRSKYRRDNPESAIINDNVVFGGIVHEAIEKFDAYEPALEYSIAEWDRIRNSNSFMDKVNKPPKSFRKMFKGYYNEILPNISADGFEVSQKEIMVEHVAPFDPNVMLIGKFDRIQTDKVWDWKTSRKPPDIYDKQDFQFYFYDYLFRLIYDMEPEIYYGYIYGGSCHKIEFNSTMQQNTVELVKHVANEMYAGIDHRVAGYQCRGCFDRDICYNDMLNEQTYRPVS